MCRLVTPIPQPLTVSFAQVEANKSKSVTKISSLGMWVPIHDEEWDGDIPLGFARSPSPQIDSENGTAVFKGNTLPWLVGKYEVRILCQSSPTLSYFHDFRSVIIMTENTMS
jgi:hypothetical protein